MKKTIVRGILFVLVVMLVHVSIIGSEVFAMLSIADSDANIIEKISIVKDDELPSFISKEEAVKSKHIKRLYEEESEDKFVFENSDGTKTAYLIDINNDLQSEEIIKTTYTDSYNFCSDTLSVDFSKNLFNEGVVITKKSNLGENVEGESITLLPVLKKTMGVSLKSTVNLPICDNETIRYDNYLNENLYIKYTMLENGVKEEIVYNQYADVNSFDFTLELEDNMIVLKDDISYYIEKDGVEEARISNVFVYDSSAHIIEGSIVISKSNEKANAYSVKISFDKSFLTNPNTVYPVYVDPTVTFSSSSNSSFIEDTCIYANKPSMNASGWTYDNVGYTDSTYGLARLLVKLPGLYNSELYNNISASQINSAYYGLYEAGGTAAKTVKAYAFEGNTWSENTATWNSVNPNAYYDLLDTKSPGANQNIELNITNLIKGWKTGKYDYNKGMIIVNNNEQSSSYLKVFNSSEHTLGSVRPYIKITYNSLVTDGIYYINNLYSGQFIQPSSQTIANNTNIFQQYANSTGTQKWYIKDLNNGYYSIRPNSNRSYVMSAQNSNSGTLIVLNNYGVSDANLSYLSQWEIMPSTNNTFQIKNRQSGLLLDLASRSFANSVKIEQYSSSTHDATKWRIIEENNYVKSTSITIDISSHLIYYGNQDVASAMVGGNTASIKKYRWSVSDSSILSIGIMTGVIIPKKAGTVTITATTLDTGISSSATIIVRYPKEDGFDNSNFIYIENAYLDKYVDISGGNADGAIALMYSLHGALNQKFKIIRDVGAGYYRIYPQNATSKVLHCNSNNKVVLSSDTTNYRSYWRIVKSSSSEYTLYNRYNDYKLCVVNDGNDNSQELICSLESMESYDWNLIRNNTLLANSLDFLHAIARECYPGYTYGDSCKLILQYIRSTNYLGPKWDLTGGVINYTFVNFVDTHYPQLKFLKYGNMNFYDLDGNSSPSDFTHMMATLNAYFYDTPIADIPIIEGIVEDQINIFAGWAGDLQQVAKQLIDDSITDNQLYNELKYLIGLNDGQSSFSLRDFNADMDVINFMDNYYNTTELLGTQLLSYYSTVSKHSGRIVNFVDGCTNNELKDRALFYTWNEYICIEGYSVTLTQAIKIAEAFADDIFESYNI